jgi:hypothetical protein
MGFSDPPVDILVGIVEKLLEDRGIDWSYALWLASVSKVNRQWRVIIVNTPLLWTHIYGLPLSRIRLYLKRSLQSPLHINYGNLDSQSKFVRDLLELLMAHLSRIKSLRLQIEGSAMIFVITSLNDGSASELKELNLDTYADVH